MITARKLAALSGNTRLRKIVRLLQEWQNPAMATPDPLYVRDVLGLLSAELLGGAEALLNDPCRYYNSLQYKILNHLGQSVADWDLTSPADKPRHRGSVEAFAASVYLEDLRSPFNVGSIFRTSEAYGLKEVILSPECPSPDHPRLIKSAMGTLESLPWRQETLDELVLRSESEGLSIFALELGGTLVDDFVFPQRGICLLGSEELGLSGKALEIADKQAGRVTLPLYGTKASLNVGVAWGILAAFWTRALLAENQR